MSLTVRPTGSSQVQFGSTNPTPPTDKGTTLGRVKGLAGHVVDRATTSASQVGGTVDRTVNIPDTVSKVFGGFRKLAGKVVGLVSGAAGAVKEKAADTGKTVVNKVVDKATGALGSDTATAVKNKVTAVVGNVGKKVTDTATKVGNAACDKVTAETGKMGAQIAGDVTKAVVGELKTGAKEVVKNAPNALLDAASQVTRRLVGGTLRYARIGMTGLAIFTGGATATVGPLYTSTLKPLAAATGVETSAAAALAVGERAVRRGGRRVVQTTQQSVRKTPTTSALLGRPVKKNYSVKKKGEPTPPPQSYIDAKSGRRKVVMTSRATPKPAK